MKNSDEMVNSLLERRNQYLIEQKRKRKRLVRVVIVMGCVCLVALVSFGMWQDSTKDDGIYAAGDEDNGEGIFCGDYWVNEETNHQQSNQECSSASTNYESDHIQDSSKDVVDVIGTVIINGVTYKQCDIDAKSYTRDTCLGAASDFEGTYQESLREIDGKLYTTKEDQDVLIVILLNGDAVVLKKEN